jgi:aerobic-type carbon monoxide dehydrogenase small subunit (CoxS/CutS family)
MSADSSEAIEIAVNGRPRTVRVPPDMPLLWVLREQLGLTGTKYGCGRGLCGACSVLVDGELARSCQLTAAAVSGRKVTTIEGLAAEAGQPVVEAWIAEQVPQCGFCQSGQIVAATALLARSSSPTEAEIDRFMAGNVCRCGTYVRIRCAIRRAAGQR